MELRLASTKRRSQKTAASELIEPRIVAICGVEYFIDWDALHVGASFFIPTVATPKQVLAALTPTMQALDIGLVAYPRVEYERYGARVWRTY